MKTVLAYVCATVAALTIIGWAVLAFIDIKLAAEIIIYAMGVFAFGSLAFLSFVIVLMWFDPP